MMNIWDRLASSFEGLDDLSRIYRELEAEITVFKAQTGLECINRCKTCCQTEGERIEATVLETLPLGASTYGKQAKRNNGWIDSPTPALKSGAFFSGARILPAGAAVVMSGDRWFVAFSVSQRPWIKEAGLFFHSVKH